MLANRNPSMNSDEALQFHHQTMVVDSQQPGITSGVLYTETMHEVMQELVGEGLSRREINKRLQAMAVREIRERPESAKQYMSMWEESGVNVASGTYAGPHPPEGAFETSVTAITQARAIIDSLGSDQLRLVLTADDIESVYKDGVRGVILDFQETAPFGTDLNRIDTFYNMGLRVVQLTYNLRNLVGDGCTERYKTGLTYYGIEVVNRLNELGMLVDVSHCSEQVGFDAVECSTSPVIVTHSASSAICYHDRGKSDELARAIADNGGFFGVAAIGGFLRSDFDATLEDFADHVQHLVNVMGIDHVGIGSDKCGPGPGTESYFEFPPELGPFDTSYLYSEKPDHRATQGGFSWSGFREEHRLSDDHRIAGFDQFTDWPSITVKLAERGFSEEELRKILGLNYLRVFREVVG